MDAEQSDKYRKLGLNIAYQRKDKVFTQDEFSEKLGISKNHLSKIESAKVGASLDILFKMADILQTDVYKLFVFPE